MRIGLKTSSRVLVSAALLLGVSGCYGPRTTEPPLVGEFGKSDIESQLDFWHRLNAYPMTSHDDAFHGLLLYVDGKDDSADYAGRVAQLKRLKMLPANFDRPADEAITRGTLAVAIVRTIKLRGGVALTMLGPTPRYAVRELQYVGLYPPSSPNQTFSGAEFVGIIGRMEDYQRGNPADKPAAELPDAGEQSSAQQ